MKKLRNTGVNDELNLTDIHKLVNLILEGKR